MHYNPFTDTLSTEPEPNAVPISAGDDIPFTSLEDNHAFLPGSSFQHAWDSTSLGLLKTCPRKYQFAMLEGLVPFTIPPPLVFGKHFHTCMEIWHKLRTAGMDPDLALQRVTRLALLLGETITPGDTARTKETLTRAVVLYLDQFRDDALETLVLPDGSPAVEHSFCIPLFSVENVPIYLSGHIDRLVSLENKPYFTDYKTSKYALDDRFFSGFKPSNQMSIYALATCLLTNQSACGGIIDGIQLGVNFCRYRRQPILFSAGELEETIQDLEAWVKMAYTYAMAKYWPKNEESCHKYSGCVYLPLCTKAPQVAKLYKSKFAKRLWDPTRPR